VRLTHVPINSFVSLGSNELTDPDRSLTTAIDPQTDLPQTFVPGRNLIFLSLAAALAYSRGIRDLAGGMCEADYSGYPDCRREFIDSSERSISLALDARFRIHTPLMHLTKAQTWLLAQELGALDLVLEHSHTCYAGDRITRHAWGFGCGQCAACQLRAQGYHQAFAKS
jgi:7-cyano-7-deazaguanine synthase